MTAINRKRVWIYLGFAFGISWLTFKAQNVWPAVIGHGALNGIAAIGILLVRGEPSTLLGPAPTGVIGGLTMTLFAAALLIVPKGFNTRNEPAGPTA